MPPEGPPTRSAHDGLRVLKVGGRPQADPALGPAVLAAWSLAPGRLVLVHGGGDELSQLMRAMGREPEFRGGRRVTAEADLDLVRMALSGLANQRLVSRLAAARAVGISGEDDGLITATLAHDGALGRVGEPHATRPSLVHTLLATGHLPVVSPVARAAEDGGAYNVNGDDAAAALAVGLNAIELVLVSDVPAVLDEGRPVSRLPASAARAMIADGRAAGGMAAKLEAALAAVTRGVPRVRIGNLHAINDPAAGTLVLADSGATP
ncbi:MAG: acetylglutamate kinase [Gemmatimonadaceae bacterium]|jgi:acetylglutamate kinase|nr:acetylglutamate kinase [Gemmatimonadaceae bacterium]